MLLEGETIWRIPPPRTIVVVVMVWGLPLAGVLLVIERTTEGSSNCASWRTKRDEKQPGFVDDDEDDEDDVEEEEEEEEEGVGDLVSHADLFASPLCLVVV